MRTKWTKNGFLRMLAIMLALVMISGEPVRAFAAEFDSDAENAEEIEILTDDYEEDYEEDFDLDEPEDDIDVITEDTEDDIEITPEFMDAILDAADNEIVISADEGEGEEAKSDDINIEDEDALDNAIELLRSSGADSLENLGNANIPADAYQLTRFEDHLCIENKATGTEKKDNLYVALIYADEKKQGKITVFGHLVAPGTHADLSVVYDEKGDKVRFEKDTDYILWIGRPDSYTDKETGETTYFDFKILGCIPDPDGGEAQKTEMDEIPVPASESKKYDGEWQDGYTGIKMKAMIQKNMTSVKISWALDTKNKPEQKEFKKYSLYQLDADSKEKTGYKETLISKEFTTSKSFTQKNVKVETDSLLYLLKCYDKEGTLKAQFVTVAAPYMLEMQSGSNTGKFDYTMTQRPDTTDLYLVELAERNKESDGVKVTDGFQLAWTTVYQVEEGFNEGNSIGQYYISKSNTPNVIQLMYSEDLPQPVIGKTYYGRIQVVKFINNLLVASAPSNVLNCKAGPQKCYMLGSAGVYYDAKNAKNNNKENIRRASDHINEFLNGDEFTRTSRYVHHTNTDVCYKDGLIYFMVDKNAEGIKSFDLLKCDHENGKYKKVKNFTFTNKALMKCDNNVTFLSDYDIYAIYYNNFTPEKDAYYAVRSVSTTKSTPGGRGAGELIKPNMDSVQGLATSTVDVNKISLGWTADDCVKQYWIYRRGEGEKYPEKPLAKVGIGKAKKYTDDDEYGYEKTFKIISYTDSKNIKSDTPYYYIVRPIYNSTAASKDKDMYMDKCSNEVVGTASALYTPIKNFKAANEAIGQIKLSWSQVKQITHYRIYRLEVKESRKKIDNSNKPDLTALYEKADKEKYKTLQEFENFLATQPLNVWKEIVEAAGADGINWQFIDEVITDGQSNGKKEWTDKNVEVGKYYFYMIQGATAVSSSINFTYTSRVRNVPLPVSGLKASYNDGGIKLEWSFNKLDKAYKDDLNVQISTDGGKNWKDLKEGKTSYTDYNVRRGSERTYRLRVNYNGVHSSESTITYSLPTGIEVNNAGDAGSLNDSTFTLKVGETGKMSYRAYLSDGSTASYNEVASSNPTADSNILRDWKVDGNSVTFTGNNPGTCTLYLSCAGVSRTIKIVVTSN